MINLRKFTMIRNIIFILIFICFNWNAFGQDQLSYEANKFKNNILSFMREEGFLPSSSNYGKQIDFKKEGQSYWIILAGDVPVKVSFHIEGFGLKDANYLALLLACNEINRDKYYVKAYTTNFDDDGSANLAIEIPCHTAEEFRYVFYDCIRALSSARNQLQESYNSHQQGLDQALKPFEIISCSVANVKKNGSYINNYGSPIYSYQTQYLKPRIEIKSEQNGTFTIYYKLITPTGSLSTGTSSPNGYSTSGEIKVTYGTKTYDLPGWGGEDSGHWKAGNYRYEFFCDNASLGYYEFTIK